MTNPGILEVADQRLSRNACYLDNCLVSADERLKRGIWPTSVAIWVIAIYMALFLIRPWETLIPWLASIRFERTYAIAMIVLVATSRGMRLRLDSQTRAVMIFLALLAVSAVFAWNPSMAWNDSQGLYAYLTLVVFYCLLISAVRTPYELVFLITFYLAVMGIYMAKSQWEFWIHGAGRASMGVMRLNGISEMFGHPNALAASTVLSLPAWYFLFRVRESVSYTWPRFWRTWFERAVLFYPALAVFTVVFTKSRGGMLALFIFGCITVFRGQKPQDKLKYTVAIFVVACIAWASMDVASRNRLRSIWDSTASNESAKESAEGRSEGFQAGLAMFRQFPVTGVGIGNFVEYRAQFVDGVRLAAHNLAGQTLGETGLLGAGGFLLLVWTTLSNCRLTKAIARQSPDETLQILAQLANAARDTIVLALFCGLFCHNLYWFVWLWFAAFAALAARFALERRAHATALDELGYSIGH